MLGGIIKGRQERADLSGNGGYVYDMLGSFCRIGAGKKVRDCKLGCPNGMGEVDV